MHISAADGFARPPPIAHALHSKWIPGLLFFILFGLRCDRYGLSYAVDIGDYCEKKIRVDVYFVGFGLWILK